ncbi:MAG: hypothetical protein H6974_12255 [Gammaproteobacteria bacterium]|nr:hypothetical protein [Gammaproteobacteria bacterium]
MALLDYWAIFIEVKEFKPSLSIQQMRDGLYLSPNVKLSGFPSMAYIESEQLAKEYLKACVPVFEKRYKHGYEAEVQKHSASKHKSVVSRIERDSAIIRERIKTCNFAPNKKVEIA